jgi:hypothetical protein
MKASSEPIGRGSASETKTPSKLKSRIGAEVTP